ncbi:MAG: nucleotide exchange factor GrpE [Anaerolineae bacterium]|nr:nucleotide exchange factor GrpE [Anaerolineae bacterium]MDQ7036241.1 nucleotide exchange factor GrpE [Anaerolineae bacterium]
MDEQAENVENMAKTKEEEILINVADDSEGNDEITALQAELDKVKQEAQSNLDGWQRSRAEFTNYKRRTAQELSESRERGALDALGKVLPIMDDFERALDNIPEDLQDHPWVSGTSLILKNMQKVTDEYNISIIDPVGEEFDPNFHEAIGTDDDSEFESGVVSVTLQKGYRSGERVLRPALVRVAS